MKQIRHGVFETNSSSTHSITMCMESDFIAWKNGDVYLNDNSGWSSYSIYKDQQFVTKEEAIDILTNNKYPPSSDLSSLSMEDLEEWFKESEIYTYHNYGSEYFEDYEDSITTPNGDTVVAFGYYGYNC